MIGTLLVPDVVVAVVALTAVGIVAVAGSPRRLRQPGLAAVTVASVLAGIVLLLSGSTLLRAILLPAMLVPMHFLPASSERSERGRAALRLLIAGMAVPLIAAWLLETFGSAAMKDIAHVLLVLSLVWRLGAFPLHGWLPELAESSPLPAILLAAGAPLVPMLLLGAFAELSPSLATTLREPLILCGTVGAIYGATLALAQNHLRRMLSYLAVGQAGAMLAAIASGSAESSTGVMLAALGYGFPFCGLTMLAVAIEARTGTARIDRLHGLAAPMPHLAASFLVLGFCFVGFPGSLGFVAEDFMLHGILDTHPVTGALILLATAIQAITMFRAFQRVFLGPPPVREGLLGAPDLVARERAVIVALVFVIGGTGVLPGPLVDRIHESFVPTHATHSKGLP